MKTAHFDCYSGISGDMCLGALIDAGADLNELKKSLGTLGIANYGITKRKVVKGGIAATRVNVKVQQKEPLRRLADILSIIGNSDLPEHIVKDSSRIFRQLFRTEAKIHSSPLKDAHLHELSATDCIIDIVGTLLCLHHLGVEGVTSSPINLGGGTVETAHGLLPVPAPATAELLKGIPVYSSGPARELTTPTGAVIIRSLASSFGSPPSMIIRTIGYGAGGHDFKGRSNTLRVIIGETVEKTSQISEGRRFTESLIIIQTNIDDMNPQVYGYLIERLLGCGALDAYLTNVMMKKGRPGIVLNVLSTQALKYALIDIILNETTTIGVRFFDAERVCIGRKIRKIQTEYGPVRFKIITSHGEDRFLPEYEDCKRISIERNLPLIEVMQRLRDKGPEY
ncbi:hypothetical protein BMS3Abin08_01381 [bacterium BMS3Abin08]|nr:hypothetical protein BMS3Abin08_01381 [bacterium BMS3Abin08]